MGNETALIIQKRAMELFKKRGYANVTIDTICQVSGITKSTFYYHFKAKEQLLDFFYEYTAELSPETMGIIVNSDNNWEKLWACFEQIFNWNIEAGPAILTQVYINNLQECNDILALPHVGKLQPVYLGILQKGQESGQFQNKEDPKLLLRIIYFITSGVSVQWCVHNGDFDAKEAIKRSLITLLGVRADLIQGRPEKPRGKP